MRNNRFFLILAGVLALNCGTLMAFFERDVVVGETAGNRADGVALLEFDGNVYRHSGELSRSIRLFDRERNTVPFLLVRVEQLKETATRYVPCETRITGLERRGDGSAVLRFELPKPPPEPLAQMELKTPEKDFDKKIRLYAIGADGSKRLLTEEAFFDYSSKVNLSRMKFTFPETSARRFELEIDNYLERGESPVRKVVTGDRNYVTRQEMWRELLIKSVVMYGSIRHEARPKIEPVELTSQPAVTENRRTRIVFSAGNAPLARVKLECGDPNFARAYELRNDKGALLRSGKLRRVTADGVRKTDEVAIALDGDRSDSYELTIFNQDNPALEVTGMTGSREVWGLLFFPPEEPLVCVYGAPEKTPEFDIGEILRYSPEENYVRCRLGAERELPDRRNLLDDYSFWLFRGAIALALLAVLWILIRSFGRIEKIPGD